MMSQSFFLHAMSVASVLVNGGLYHVILCRLFLSIILSPPIPNSQLVPCRHCLCDDRDAKNTRSRT